MRSPSPIAFGRPAVPAIVLCVILGLVGSAVAQGVVTVEGKPLGWPYGQPSAAVPDSYHSHFALGQELMQAGDTEGAAREFLDCIRLFEPYVSARERTGDYQDALITEVYFRPLATSCVNLGHSLVKMNRLDTAIELYTGAADLAPGYVPAHESLGRALIEKGQAARTKRESLDNSLQAVKPTEAELNLYRSAVAHLYVACQLENQNPSVRVALSQGLLNWGVLDGALVHAQHAAKLAPSDAECQFTLGNAYAAVGQHQAAADAFREALRVGSSKPDDFLAGIHAKLAQALSALGQFDDAVKSYQRAVALAPLKAEYQNNMGAALRAAGKTPEAVTAHLVASAIDPSTIEYYTNLAATSAEAGNWDAAINAYRNALRLNSKTSRLHHQYGRALHQRSQLTNAINTYFAIKDAEVEAEHVEGALALIAAHYLAPRRLQLVDAMDPSCYEVVPRLALSPDRWATMRKELTHQASILDKRPLFEDARLQLQDMITSFDLVEPAVLHLIGQFDKVLTVKASNGQAFVPAELSAQLLKLAAADSMVAASAQSLPPEVKRAVVGAAQVLRQLDDIEEATAELRWARTLEPSNAYILVDLGQALMDSERVAQALSTFRQAARLEPDMAETHFGGGIALGRLGSMNLASDAWTRALDMNMKDARLCSYLGLAHLQDTELDLAYAMFKRATAEDEKSAPAQYYVAMAEALRVSASPITAQTLLQARQGTKLGKLSYNVRAEFIKQEALAAVLQAIDKADSLDPGRRQDYFCAGVDFALHDPAISDLKGLDVIHTPARVSGLVPDWASVTNNIAACAAMRGDLNKAEKLLRIAVRDREDYAVGHWNLGRVLMAKKLEGEGLKELGLAAKYARAQGLPYTFDVPAPTPAAVAMPVADQGVTTPKTPAAPCAPWQLPGLLESFAAPSGSY